MDHRKRNLGKRFEELIERANIHYYFLNLAWIEKQEVQKKYVNGRLVYTKKGAPDFMGSVAGGRAISFDCKSTKGKSLPIKKNILSRPHQLQQLKKLHDLGGIAFYLIEFTDEKRYFVLTIPEVEKWIKQMEDGGRCSIPMEACKKEVKPDSHSVMDYLKPFHLKGSGSNGKSHTAI